MNEQVRPPQKLSNLITLAIADARRLDRDVYTPNSEVWHEPHGGTCMVCLSGCLIAATLEAPRVEVVIRQGNLPDDETDAGLVGDEEWRQALEALEHVRRGEWRLAMSTRSMRVEEETASKLSLIPPPFPRWFEGWQMLDAHLASLEDKVAKLRLAGV